MKKILATVLFSMIAASAWANDVIRIIAAFPVGGPSDRVVRLVQKDLREAGRTVIVENKPGGNGDIAWNHFLQTGRSETVFMHMWSPTFFLNKTNLDGVEPVVNIGTQPFVVTVSPGVKFRTWAEFMAVPATESVTFASAGRTSASYLGIEALKHHSKKNIITVNYTGGPQMVIDVAAARVDMGMFHAAAVWNNIETGKMIPIAVMSNVRMADLPAVPTGIEMGFADSVFGSDHWFVGLTTNARADTEFFRSTMTKILRDPTQNQPYLRERIQLAPSPLLPANHIQNEIKRVRALIDRIGITWQD